MSSEDLISKIDELILQIKDSQKERISNERSNRMKSKILADSTVRKAMELVRKNQVSKINEKLFLVNGTSDSQYHVMRSEKYELVCVNINQKSICTTGKILEYSECCINWFDENQSMGWEEVYEFVMENGETEKVEEIAEMMHQYYESGYVHTSKERIRKILVNHVVESRNTMPFIFFQPCDVCIGPSSPSRKLNDRYAKFAKEKFPQLYQKIIEEGKKDAKFYE